MEWLNRARCDEASVDGFYNVLGTFNKTIQEYRQVKLLVGAEQLRDLKVKLTMRSRAQWRDLWLTGLPHGWAQIVTVPWPWHDCIT